MTPWEDSKFNPCNLMVYWAAIKWMDSECMCCALTRGVVFGIGIGLVISSGIGKFEYELWPGIALIVLTVVLSMFGAKKAE